MSNLQAVGIHEEHEETRSFVLFVTFAVSVPRSLPVLLQGENARAVIYFASFAPWRESLLARCTCEGLAQRLRP